MTLPELVETANCYTYGTISLSPKEREYLIALLKAYAEDVLNSGQAVRLGTVVMTKSIQGWVSVQLVT